MFEQVLNTSTQPVFTCPKLTIETLKQGVKIFSKLTVETPEQRQWFFEFSGSIKWGDLLQNIGKYRNVREHKRLIG